jgi:hypothetical protein
MMLTDQVAFVVRLAMRLKVAYATLNNGYPPGPLRFHERGIIEIQGVEPQRTHLGRDGKPVLRLAMKEGNPDRNIQRNDCR